MEDAARKYKQIAIFIDVEDVYDITKSILCLFELEEPETVALDDFIGLHKVGSLSPDDRIATVDVILINSDIEARSSTGCAVFQGELLESLKDSIDFSEFYQFCYHRATENGTVILGDSLPFHLHDGSIEEDFTDRSKSDDEDFVVVKSRNSSYREQFNHVLRERDDLKKQLSKTRAELELLRDDYNNLQTNLTDLDVIVQSLQSDIKEQLIFYQNRNEPVTGYDMIADLHECNLQLHSIGAKLDTIMQLSPEGTDRKTALTHEYLDQLSSDLDELKAKYMELSFKHDSEFSEQLVTTENLRSELKRLSELLEICEDDKKKLLEKNKSIAVLESECEDLRKKVQSWNSEYKQQLATENKELKQQLEALNQEIQRGINAKEKLAVLLTSYKAHFDDSKKENYELKQQLEAVNQELQSSMDAKEKLAVLTTSYKALSEESKNLADLRRKASLYYDVSSCLALLRTENAELKEANKHLSTVTTAQAKRISELEMELYNSRYSDQDMAWDSMYSSFSRRSTKKKSHKNKDFPSENVASTPYIQNGSICYQDMSFISEINRPRDEDCVVQFPVCDAIIPPFCQ